MEKFFSKKNFQNFLWALIGALIIFICGIIWNWWSGPQEVKVISEANSSIDTTVTILRVEPFEILHSSKDEKANATQVIDNRLIDSIIRKAIADQYNKESEINYTPVIKNQTFKISALNRPKFKMPSIVKGYTQGKLNSYALIDINKKIFNNDEKIELVVEFFDQKTISLITPIFVELAQRKTAHSKVQIWTDQFVPSNQESKINFSSSFPKNKYELTVGFYIKSEINNEYPNFYYKTFNIEIK